MENMAEEAKALLAVAERQGAENLRKKILAPTAAMPSIEEVESELRGNFREREDYLRRNNMTNAAKKTKQTQYQMSTSRIVRAASDVAAVGDSKRPTASEKKNAQIRMSMRTRLG